MRRLRRDRFEEKRETRETMQKRDEAEEGEVGRRGTKALRGVRSRQRVRREPKPSGCVGSWWPPECSPSSSLLHDPRGPPAIGASSLEKGRVE
jgi:hypothetical protein